MAYKTPWSNFHELNLDWLLQKVKEISETVDSIIGSATPSASIPEMDGIGSPGTEDNYARGDHRHPTDTSRAAQSDLTQEITDRGNADNTLQTNIDTVDEKIKFSAAAPLMDSSSASAGFSDFMARADHIHPTDTSRASATDLATLTARVDGFAGSANPSDTMPNMDGVGSAGTGGNYSRGDHVHPSDTSKVNKSGDTITGDLKIDGALIPRHELEFTHINSIGWVRIANFPNIPGTWAMFAIVRKGDVAPSEIHTIELCINQNGINFRSENSYSDVLYIDQIRYTDAGKVDIHMDQNAESDIGVRLIAVGPTETITNNVKLIPFQGVAPSPLGETVLMQHNFTSNTDATGTPTLAEYGDMLGSGGYIRAINGIVYIKEKVTMADTPASGWRNVLSIPTGFTPLVTHDFFAMDNARDTPIHARLDESGQLTIWPDSAIASGSILIFNIIYPIIPII